VSDSRPPAAHVDAGAHTDLVRDALDGEVARAALDRFREDRVDEPPPLVPGWRRSAP
jgi:hypothetical protein